MFTRNAANSRKVKGVGRARVPSSRSLIIYHLGMIDTASIWPMFTTKITARCIIIIPDGKLTNLEINAGSFGEREVTSHGNTISQDKCG